jgi:hypothetical protein
MDNNMSDTLDIALTKRLIAVMQAYADGKRIEYRNLTASSMWKPVINCPLWNWDACDYRIAIEKPSINWDHVSKKYNYLAIDENGVAYMYAVCPELQIEMWSSEESFICPDCLASFNPGNCDWKDSLVCRPGFEDKE